ncbi:NAD(P)-dependent alcohol dehydrogenase [Mucilaginibacter sp. BT774]|uniref:NAD(P)-dependent alcohol dehydrogenase n=1 Tax=Mucilaginibacter sp. BT774 TaxID=3062276 RepID=UPI00267549E9|nr:NAD(P)-dependent alcohol dehydrogenase [Mucilaginibacter sp. BT774]MDO3625137.1 NAD(P)-dependent alcohol dehydrogenase [Mucilaginibacter sp. BT774]
MKAVTYSKYGPPGVLQINDVEIPVPNDNEVLIKVCAASVNPLDWHFMRGTPYPVRLMTGLRKPKVERLGADVAGYIEVVGKNVTQFKAGDSVFGSCRGAFAEYACASESTLVIKPENVSFEQAASVPIGTLTALQGLRNKGRIQQGKHVLINGAAGGVGTFAVQIAKSFGADVTGVCSTRNMDMVRSIGAEHVFDYTRENFTQSAQCYDLIFDTVGNHSLSEYKRVLNQGGIYVGAGGPSDVWMIGPIIHAIQALMLSSIGSKKFVGFLAKINKDDLILIKELMQSGKIAPVIDRSYKLTEIHEAIRYLEGGHARGKVVIVLG